MDDFAPKEEPIRVLGVNIDTSSPVNHIQPDQRVELLISARTVREVTLVGGLVRFSSVQLFKMKGEGYEDR